MYDTIVIGAGQAGVAAGYYLKRSKQHFLLLDKGNEVGESWKERYDSLVLFTPRMYSCLPGMPLEGEEKGFPTKNEIVTYLKKYANKFEIPIQFQTNVINVLKGNDYFYIKTNRGEYHAKNIVIATGPFQSPNIPLFSKGISTHIKQIHSSQYKNPKQLLEGNVLVVGGGNSGAQIAVELSKERDTYLAISKKLSYFPLIIRKKSIFWWLDKFGVLKANTESLLGKFLQKKGDPIFGLELKRAITNKEVKTKPRVIGHNQNRVTFEDSSSMKVNNIIWATGFKSDYSWLNVEGILNENGKVLHKRGVSNVRGLYFIGLPWQYRRGSALLQGVGLDAKYIVNQITNHSC